MRSPDKNFLPDQSLYHLQFPGSRAQNPDKKAWLATDRLPEFDTNSKRSGSSKWVLIYGTGDRRAFLRRLGEPERKVGLLRRLLCFTASSGIGKSIALEQIADLRTMHPDHVVIRYHFSELPLNANHYTLTGIEKKQLPNSTNKTLVDAFLRSYVDSASAPMAGQNSATLHEQAVLILLERKIAKGEVTLIVDGLDESNDPTEGIHQANALRQLLSSPKFQYLHCVVAGRPYAIVGDYWQSLFASDTPSRNSSLGDYPTSEWEFCLVAPFTDEQCKRYLGSRYALLSELRSQASLSPRHMEVLRSLPKERFTNLHSLGCVYWEALTASFRMDVSRKDKGLLQTLKFGINEKQYVAYLCALAYITLEKSKDLKTVLLKNVENLLHTRLKETSSWTGISFDDFVQRLEAIGKLNTYCIEFHYFQMVGKEQVVWADRTVMEFFAAMWLVRYSSQEQRERIKSEIPRRREREVLYENRRELWLLIAGMPEDAFEQYDDAPIEARWLELVRGLFGRFTEGKRPAELMSIAWDNLERLVSSDDHSKDASRYPTCESVMAGYRADYSNLRNGIEEAATIIDQDLESQFRTIEKPACGWDKVPVGHSDEKDNPPKTVALQGPYSVCAFPVTGRLYRLFDPFHEQMNSGDFDKYCEEERCPVICITWWDAKMFAIWSHSRLMSEWEWEYACRANCRDTDGKLSKYYWRDDPTGEQLSNHVWFGKNSIMQTHLVGGKDPNDYKLHDMLGNVWEWTESRHALDGVSRVLRGGSFHYFGRGASSSYRLRNVPSHSLIDNGFRVARGSLRKS